MKTEWIALIVWAHFSGGWHTTTISNLSSEEACKVMIAETVKAINPWEARKSCIKVASDQTKSKEAK